MIKWQEFIQVVDQVARVQVVVDQVAGTQMLYQVARAQLVVDQVAGAQVLDQVAGAQVVVDQFKWPELRCWIKWQELR